LFSQCATRRKDDPICEEYSSLLGAGSFQHKGADSQDVATRGGEETELEEASASDGYNF
jgi:hypothetical protein